MSASYAYWTDEKGREVVEFDSLSTDTYGIYVMPEGGCHNKWDTHESLVAKGYIPLITREYRVWEEEEVEWEEEEEAEWEEEEEAEGGDV